MSKSICVVLPVYNAQEWVGRAILSVRQSCEDALIVAVDDGSTDGSVAAIRALPTDVHLETGPNRGACHARNRGLEIAQAAGAQYVLFLDADDEIEGEMLSGVCAAVATQTPDIVFSRQHRHVNGDRLSTHVLERGELTPQALFELWLTRPQLNPGAIAWKRDFLTRIGGWNEDVLINQDGELVLRAMLHDPVLAWNDRGASIYYIGKEASLSTNKSRVKLDNYVTTLSGLWDRAQGTPFAAFCGGIEATLYGIARMAFRHGWSDVGRRGLLALRERGVCGHYGSPSHRLSARILGLENKVRIWGR